MGIKFCAEEPEEAQSSEDIRARLDLSSMNIAEYERRVKRYAHPGNKGKVTADQLMEAFKDTNIFS